MAESLYKITQWPKNERPRERLLQHGPQHLTEAELLGILLGKGTKKKTAIDLARELLNQYESLQRLFSCSPSELTTIKGIGSAKAAILSAAFELVRRIQSQKSPGKPFFRRSSDVADHYLPLMRDFKERGLQSPPSQPGQSVDQRSLHLRRNPRCEHCSSERCIPGGPVGTCGRNHPDPQPPEWKPEPQRRRSPNY